MLYEPFGAVRQWTWGNGSLTARTYDQDGRIDQIDSKEFYTFDYDAAGRLTQMLNTSKPTESLNPITYDALDRLTGFTRNGGTTGFTYDANGNRLSLTGGTPSAYTISPTSNRIASISGGLIRTYGYNAAGNTTSYGNIVYAYNNRGRVKSATVGATATNYVYNALGQLVKKSGGGGTTLLMYDEPGHLLGEYSSTGGLVQETVWLGDIPVATLRPITGGVDIFYVHTDQINAVRKVTRRSDNKLRWRWEPTAFGNATATENPESLGAFKYNLRFPGQYYLSETGLNYNYFRDYDPVVGRYIESDPIGLMGGINTYAYAKSNPVQYSDPDGKNAVAAGLVVVYSCATIACSYSGIKKCDRAFPDHANPLSMDRAPYAKFTQAALTACFMLNFATDPAGSVSGELGGQVGSRLSR